jgi:glycine amidinotransferase
MKQRKTEVKSWNEWDPLKHVIVGRADYTCIPWPEHGINIRFSLAKKKGMTWVGNHGPRPQETVEKANEQLDNYASILEGRGVRVDRPTPIQWNQLMQTPDWKVNSGIGCMPPRDILLVVGNEILEAAMSYRCRWFEYLAYRPLLQEYYKEDPKMRWEAAPKPRLTDATYRPGYTDGDIPIEQRLKWVAEKKFSTTEIEPLFDAADVCRLGKDLFVQHGMTCNLSGIDWLQRHFPNHRVHALNFPGDPFPFHIDASLVPLRPGLILNNPERLLPKEQRKIFEMNDWEVIEGAQPAHEKPPPLCWSSVWISMNVFVLDPKTVFVEATEVHQMEQLDKLGFEVIPVPFRDTFAFGGGLHCATTDLYREGDCEDYFPKQLKGF